MKRAILPALIAGLFAANGAIASDRELIFGPTGVVDAAPKAVSKKADGADNAPKTIKPQKADKAVKAELPPVAVTKEPKKAPEAKPADVKAAAPAAAASGKEQPKQAPVAVKPAPAAPVAQKDAPKPAPVAAKAASAPAVAAAKEAAKPAAAVAAVKEVAKPAAASAPVPAPKEAPKTVSAPPAPAPVAAAAPAVAPAIVPAMRAIPALSAPVVLNIKPGDSPLVQRQALVRDLKQSVVMGFFPSAGGEQSTTSFVADFMPLANHLSSSTAVLTTFLPERQITNFAAAILENRYPAIFINGLLASTAADAGYVPIAVTQDKLPGAFLVKEASNFKKIEDIRGARIAYSANAQSVFSAFADLGKSGINAKDNRLTDVGSSGHNGSIQALISGAADVAIVRQIDAAAAMQANMSGLRVIPSTVAESAAGVWVRKDLVDSEYARRLKSAILQVDAEGGGSGKTAAVAFARGYGVAGKFVLPDAELVSRLKQLWSQTRQSHPNLFPAENFDASAVQKNLQTAPITANVRQGADDLLQRREDIAKKMRSEMSVGFFPSGSGDKGTVAFFANYLPLSNHLSLGSDVLVNFLPERDVPSYAQRIGEQRYPVVFINAVLADAAIKAGYRPLAVGAESLRGAFLVKASSPAKKVADMRSMSIGFTSNAQSAYLGLAEMAKQGVNAKDVRLFDVRNGGHEASISALNSGAVDVALVRPSDAKKAVDESKGALRMIDGTLSSPSSGMWVRKDLAGSELARKLEASLLQVDPSGKGSAKEAADAFKAGFSTEGRFVKASDNYAEGLRAMWDELRRGYPTLFPSVSIDVTKAEQNLKKPATQAR